MDIRILVSGLVQGVGYRAWLQGIAEAHGIGGWTRNLRDGQVEAVLIGPDAALLHVLEETRNGPPAARVSHVEQRAATSAEVERGAGSFRILPTAGGRSDG